MTENMRPRVVIVGGGFAGLYAARTLRGAPVRVTVVDRRNHHLFQPLLYQVATASLSPASIAAPIRRILRRQRNAEVVLGDVVGVDLDRRRLVVGADAIEYDSLVIACGATHSYFGREEWSAFAPGLKTIEDAVEIRRRFLLAFEAAERQPDPKLRQEELTFVVVGGGPTGVELAGAMAEVARHALPRDFRRIDTTSARVILLEAADRILTAFPPELSARAARDLARMGVEVRTQAKVTSLDDRGVEIGAERIAARQVLWAAGVKASPLGARLGVPLDTAGRVIVGPDLSIPGRPEVFAIGDVARVSDPRMGMVPGVAPAAMQMGRFVGRLLAREARAPSRAAPRPTFRYRDKGILATIGRNKGVARLGRDLRFAGWLAWVLWALVHVMFLVGFRNRVLVMLEWAWIYIAFDRGARLITGGQTASQDRPTLVPPHDS